MRISGGLPLLPVVVPAGGLIAASIPVTWNNAGNPYTALDINVTDTASLASSALILGRVGGLTKFWVDKSGDVQIAPAAFFGWVTKSRISSPNDGQILLQNNAATGFTLLQFGGSSAAFAAWKSVGVTLSARLADDSGDANLRAATLYVSTPGSNMYDLLLASGPLTLAAPAVAGAAGQTVLGSGTQTTVGANGAASALTANPLGYLIAYRAGVKIAIPYYNG